MASKTQNRDRQLKILLLRYFREGHSIFALGQAADEFPGFSRDELQEAAKGLVKARFIERVRGRTKNAVYITTPDGEATLAALETLT